MPKETGGPTSAAANARLLTRADPSRATGIAAAVVIKDASLFLLTEREGGIPAAAGHGLGLYFRDCRYLSAYEVRLDGSKPEVLATHSGDGFRSDLFLTNPALEDRRGHLEPQRLVLRWRHVIDGAANALRDELTVTNYDDHERTVTLELALDADFRDVFVIRGLSAVRPGAPRPPRWRGGRLRFVCEGGDRLIRALRVEFSRKPVWKRLGTARFQFRLRPRASARLYAVFTAVESAAEPKTIRDAGDGTALAEAETAFERSAANWATEFTRVASSSVPLSRAITRALHDLRTLRMTLDEEQFFAAGVPWFVTLFGRDSLIAALQSLAYRPHVAADTLRLLARFQGRQLDATRHEEPGKILHELRMGELARMGAVPYTPYYGSVDATPLFLIVLGEYLRWTGDLALAHDLHDAIEGALEWMAIYGDHDGDGYLDYVSRAAGRLVNQGWKDSGNGIVNADGALAVPPVALVEVQGYAFLARQHAASLFERLGDAARAAQLRAEARDLQRRFNRDFWMPDRGFYALALQKGGRQAAVITSNPGQALWTGIVSQRRRRRVAARLMADDMYSGWGIRTLSSRERAYNPVGYHVGTVWPHDNAFIAAAFHRCGFGEWADRIFDGLLDAASCFEHFRLPEVFAGIGRDEYELPVHYPIACHPQAWAAGTLPYLLQALLGLEPDAFGRRLSIVRPRLPASIPDVRLEGLRVGEATVGLQFTRGRDGTAHVKVGPIDGTLEVDVSP